MVAPGRTSQLGDGYPIEGYLRRIDELPRAFARLLHDHRDRPDGRRRRRALPADGRQRDGQGGRRHRSGDAGRVLALRRLRGPGRARSRGLASNRGFVDALAAGGSRARAGLRGVAARPGVVGVAFKPAEPGPPLAAGSPERHRRRGRPAGRRPRQSPGHAEPVGHHGPQLRRRLATAHRPPGRGQPRRAPAGRHQQRRADGAHGWRRLRVPG